MAVGRLALVAALVVTGTALGAGSSGSWRPHVCAAERYAAQRHGVIAFAVRTRTRSWGWHRTTTFPSASVVKAMLLVAYLDTPSVRGRRLRPADGALLVPMIRHSDNDAASKVLSIVGSARVYDVARRARMRRFTLVTGYWGLSRIDAADQARFFLRIDALTAKRHRRYALRLLRTITPVQRWGIARVRPSGWRLYFKGGWTENPGWVDHQVALLTRGHERVAVAILTYHGGDHAYGRRTLRGIAARLLRGLGSADNVP